MEAQLREQATSGFQSDVNAPHKLPISPHTLTNSHTTQTKVIKIYFLQL